MSTRTRTDFSTALTKTLEVLKNGEMYTQNKLAQKTDLNSRTIAKILVLLDHVQSVLKENEIDISALENVKVIRMRERSGLATFPENIQKMIIKTIHYPTVSREEEILTHLFLRNATTEKSAVLIPEDSILKELVEAEHVSKTNDGRFYLTVDGGFIAKGALKLYPELQEIRGPIQMELDNALRDYVGKKNKKLGSKITS